MFVSENPVPAGADDVAADLLPVGAVAARLGVAPGTVRSWGRRYGLVPAGRSPGGHRRYTGTDLARLTRMQRLVSTGMTPAAAARAALAADPATEAPESLVGDGVGRRRAGGPGGRVLAVPRGSAEVRGLARAASRLDADGVLGMLGDLLADRGAILTWDEVLRPVLVAAGEHWARTGEGIDVEHVLSDTTIEALRAHRACQPRPVPGRPVLLASAPEEEHALPLHVLAAALAQHRVPLRMLGSRVPAPTLTAAILRTGASAVFVWRQLSTAGLPELSALPRLRPPLVVVLGGPGWDDVELPPTVHRPLDLATAVRLLAASRR